MSRLLVRLVVLLVVLAVLGAGADRLALALVSRSVAEGLQVSQRLSAPATVTFRGVPFLTQAVGGRYRRVEVAMAGLPTAGPLVVDRLDATLHGVRAPAGQALRGELDRFAVESGEADAYVSFRALQAAATETLRPRGAELTLGYAAADRIAVTARIGSLLGSVTVRGQTQITVRDGVVVLRLLPDTLTGVPAALRSQVASRVNLSGLVPALPFGFRAEKVVVTPDGLRLHATGTGLSIPV